MLDNFDLVEEDEGAEHGEGGIVENSGQHNVFEVLETVSLVDLAANVFIIDGHDLFEASLVAEPVAVVGLVAGEIRVVFQSADNAQQTFVGNRMLNNGGVVEQENGLHDVAQTMQVRKAFQIFGNLDQGDKLVDVVFGHDEFGDGFTASSGGARGSKADLDFGQVAQFSSGEVDGGDRFDGEFIVKIIVYKGPLLAASFGSQDGSKHIPVSVC